MLDFSDKGTPHAFWLAKSFLVLGDIYVQKGKFLQPLFEFSGACAGCGETPYVKLVSQLFGDRMIVANATGCSSIYGGSAPTCPYTVDDKGHGPAWANSLFEDNAEFGYGMNVATAARRNALVADVEALMAIDYCDADLKAACAAWLKVRDEGEASKAASAKLIEELNASVIEGCPCDACTLGRKVLAQADLLVKKSIWIFGGDGWAYDIGYGGVDHVLAVSYTQLVRLCIFSLRRAVCYPAAATARQRMRLSGVRQPALS